MTDTDRQASETGRERERNKTDTHRRGRDGEKKSQGQTNRHISTRFLFSSTGEFFVIAHFVTMSEVP